MAKPRLPIPSVTPNAPEYYPGRVDSATLRRLAVEADVDPRTMKAALARRKVRGAAGHRVERVLVGHGYLPLRTSQRPPVSKQAVDALDRQLAETPGGLPANQSDLGAAVHSLASALDAAGDALLQLIDTAAPSDVDHLMELHADICALACELRDEGKQGDHG